MYTDLNKKRKTEVKLIVLVAVLFLITIAPCFAADDTSETVENITKEMALEAIQEANETIIEMIENNFSVVYMNDVLLEAKRVLERANYAEILRSESSSKEERVTAEKALQLIAWEEITYDDVLVHTGKIKERKKEAFLIFDSIVTTNDKIKSYENEGLELNEERNLLSEAETAFDEERYDEAKNLLEEIKSNLEIKSAQAATLNVLKEGAQNFFQRYWIYILIFLVVIVLLVLVFYKKIRKERLKKKIRKMKKEQIVLSGLLKKAQEERYKERKLSGIVYNIRKDKYQQRMGEIKETLPVLEEKLRRKKVKEEEDKGEEEKRETKIKKENKMTDSI